MVGAFQLSRHAGASVMKRPALHAAPAPRRPAGAQHLAAPKPAAKRSAAPRPPGPPPAAEPFPMDSADDVRDF